LLVIETSSIALDSSDINSFINNKMKTQLVFFNGIESSKEGTIRALIAFTILLIINSIWYSMLSSLYHPYNNSAENRVIKITGMFVSLVLLSSAIGVQLPDSVENAVTYGALVGLVVYGFYHGTQLAINKTWTTKIAIIDTMWGVISVGLSAGLLFLVKN